MLRIVIPPLSPKNSPSKNLLNRQREMCTKFDIYLRMMKTNI